MRNWEGRKHSNNCYEQGVGCVDSVMLSWKCISHIVIGQVNKVEEGFMSMCIYDLLMCFILMFV